MNLSTVRGLDRVWKHIRILEWKLKKTSYYDNGEIFDTRGG
jgi:hypothetical protein